MYDCKTRRQAKIVGSVSRSHVVTWNRDIPTDIQVILRHTLDAARKITELSHFLLSHDSEEEVFN